MKSLPTMSPAVICEMAFRDAIRHGMLPKRPSPRSRPQGRPTIGTARGARQHVERTEIRMRGLFGQPVRGSGSADPLVRSWFEQNGVFDVDRAAETDRRVGLGQRFATDQLPPGDLPGQLLLDLGIIDGAQLTFENNGDSPYGC